MRKTNKKRLIVKGPCGYQTVRWINMPPKGGKKGARKKKTLPQGQTFEIHETEVEVGEGVDTRSEADAANPHVAPDNPSVRAPWSDKDSSDDEPIAKLTKGIRTTKKRKKSEMETGRGAVGETAALGEAKAAVGGTAEGGVEVGAAQGPRGTRSEKRVWFVVEQEQKRARKGKQKAVEEEEEKEEEALEGVLDVGPPRVSAKGSARPALSVGESVKVFRELQKISKSTTLTERMAALIPAKIKRFAEDGVIQVPVGLLLMEEHTINGKKVAFNPRELDEGSVENIANRIRANGFDTTTFTLTRIIKVSVQTQLFLRQS
jgi:hypothetical protein